jgi:hypothetical protein
VAPRALSLLYRDVDRLPYLQAVRTCAAARGLEIALVRHHQAGSEDWSAALRRGEVDALSENYWALQRFRAAGEPFVTVASAAHTWRELLLVKPQLRSLEDLRGRTLIARGTGPQALFPAVLLEQIGLAGDVRIVVVPEQETGRWGHWQRVVDGDGDACFMLPAYADAPLAAGLHEIPYPRFGFDGAHVIPTTTERHLAEDPVAIAELVEAMFDACHLAATDPQRFLEIMRTECLDELREHFTLANEAELRRLGAFMRAEIDPVPIPTLDGLRNAHAVAGARYPELAGYNPLLMWELSFARRAQQRRG